MYKYKSKKKKFRIDMVLIACSVVFISTFVIYMFTGEIQSDKLNYSDNSSSLTEQNSSSILDSSVDSTPEETKPPEVTTTPPPKEPEEPITKPEEIINPVPKSEMKDMSYFDDCVFVGDSVTSGLSSYKFLSPDKVFASIGLNISKIETEQITTAYGKLTVHNALLKKQPKKIYIMLGTNGIAFMSDESMMEKYAIFVNKIKKDLPDSQIIVLSIPPVTAEREKQTTNVITNDDIDKYNSALLKFAKEQKIYFVDTNTALKNNDGKLDPSVAAKDGVHFKKGTYQTMIDYILSHTI